MRIIILVNVIELGLHVTKIPCRRGSKPQHRRNCSLPHERHHNFTRRDGHKWSRGRAYGSAGQLKHMKQKANYIYGSGVTVTSAVNAMQRRCVFSAVSLRFIWGPNPVAATSRMISSANNVHHNYSCPPFFKRFVADTGCYFIKNIYI